MAAGDGDVGGSEAADGVDGQGDGFAQGGEARPAQAWGFGVRGGGLNRAEDGEVAAKALGVVEFGLVVAGGGDGPGSGQRAFVQAGQLGGAQVHAGTGGAGQSDVAADEGLGTGGVGQGDGLADEGFAALGGKAGPPGPAVPGPAVPGAGIRR